jgi:hypothetical protein
MERKWILTRAQGESGCICADGVPACVLPHAQRIRLHVRKRNDQTGTRSPSVVLHCSTTTATTTVASFIEC